MKEKDENPTNGTGERPKRHNLSPEDIAKAHSPEALEKRRQTLAQKREDRLLDVVDNLHFGMVPAAIADYLGLSDSYVSKLLSEAKRRELV